MKYLFTPIFLIAATLAAFGQIRAEDAIFDLKEGTLIVKLITQQKKIDMLLKQGKKEEAIACEKEERIQNENLMQAFSASYTFSDLLFIYATDMGKLADGDPSVLFDREGNPAAAIPEKYLFLELGESLGRNIDGFVVRDRNNDQLAKPFPYFVSRWGFLHLSKKSFPSMIGGWEKQLNSFYSRAVNRQ
jgi:hypothetical protein